MNIPDLVTSVADLQTARILAAAGVGFIAFDQQIENIQDIKSWLEGPQIGIEITNPEVTIPSADFLIISYEFFELFSFSDKVIFWKTHDGKLSQPDGMIYLAGVSPPDNMDSNDFAFYHHHDVKQNASPFIKTWIDYQMDQSLYEEIFLT